MKQLGGKMRQNLNWVTGSIRASSFHKQKVCDPNSSPTEAPSFTLKRIIPAFLNFKTLKS